MTLPKGIQRTPYGFRVWQWHAREQRNLSKRFPRDAKVKDMQAWQDSVRVEARTASTIAEARTLTGFAADVATYLEAVKAMPSFQNRVREMRAWLERLGDQPALAIRPLQIRLARDDWRAHGPKRVQRRNATTGRVEWVSIAAPLSASEVNHRLRALENFFTVLYPKADNPVREVDECDEPPLQPRGQSFAVGYEVLSYMPDITTPAKGGVAEPGSLSRIRFETMLVTGLTPKQLGMLVEAEHIDWSVPSVIPPKRLKGRRARRTRSRRAPAARPLMPAALPVLRRFFDLKANRPFSNSSFGRSVKAAVRAANAKRRRDDLPLIPESATPYELTRHSFGTEVYRRTKNLKMVQDLLGHSDIRQSARYALAAVQEHQVAAIGDLSRVAKRARRSLRRKLTARPHQHQKI